AGYADDRQRRVLFVVPAWRQNSYDGHCRGRATDPYRSTGKKSFLVTSPEQSSAPEAKKHGRGRCQTDDRERPPAETFDLRKGNVGPEQGDGEAQQRPRREFDPGVVSGGLEMEKAEHHAKKQGAQHLRAGTVFGREGGGQRYDQRQPKSGDEM